jgi:YggT family protein
VDTIVELARLLVFLYILVLLARIILTLLISVSRDLKPTGVGLVITEGVFTLTDPPVKVVRKIIPPLNLGQIRIDVGFMVLLFLAFVIYNGLAWL